MSEKKANEYNVSDITLGWEAPCPAQEYVVQSDLCNMGASPVTFTTNTTNVGFTAQEVGGVYITDNTGGGGGSGFYTTDTITLGSGTYGIDTSSINFSNGTTKNTIKTTKSEIDIDELAEFIDVVKKRLLILAPNFEMHEKYPMLKELYNEYKAMERLLSGPDSSNNDE